MAGADEVGLTIGLEPFRGVLPDRVQEAEARLAADRFLDLDEALVDQRHQPVEDVATDLGRWTADRLGRGEVAPGGEDGQPVEQPPAALVEKVVAPGDRAAERLLAFGQVARSGRQDVELVIEPDEDRVRAQQLDARGGKLDRERHPVEPCADRSHRGRVLVGDAEPGANGDRPLDEQTDRRVLTQRDQVDGPIPAASRDPLDAGFLAQVGRRRQAGDLVLLFARDVQHGTARHDRLHLRGGAQQVGHDRRGCDHLLEVVEDQQEALVTQPVGERFVDRACRALGDAEGGGDARGDEHRVPDGLEGHEEDAIREVVRRPGGELERESRLAGAARAGQGQEPGRREQPGRCLDLGVATDERRQLGRQVVGPGVERPECREIGRQPGGDDLEDAHRRAQVLEPVLPEVAQRDAVDRTVDELVADQARREDLATMGERGEPCRPVDAEADEALPGLFGTAGVEAHPDPDRRVVRPWLGGQRALCRDGKYEVPSINPGWIAVQVGSAPSRLFQS